MFGKQVIYKIKLYQETYIAKVNLIYRRVRVTAKFCEIRRIIGQNLFLEIKKELA